MKMMSAFLGLFFCLMGYANAYPSNLDGSYFTRDKSTFDDPKRTRGMSFVIEGKSAEELYQAMSQQAELDLCLDDGTITKQGRTVSCSRFPSGTYSCDFGIDLKTETLTWGQSC